MMHALGQVTLITALASAGAVATWWWNGPAERSVPCEQAGLEPGEMCLDTLLADDRDILWIDARSRAQWERDGIPGSMLITDHPAENFDDLVAEAFPFLIEATRVVVYCGDTGCGTSKAVAASLRALEAGPEVQVLYGGWSALAAAGKVTASR